MFDLEFNYIKNQELALLVKPMRKAELGFNLKMQPEKLSAYLDIASYPYKFFRSVGFVFNYHEKKGAIDFGWQDNEYQLNHDEEDEEDLWRLWAEIDAHIWRDLELNLSKTVEELSQDSQLIQANSKKKLRDNKNL